MPAERKAGARPMKSERTHEENQERAYIAASRRSDRSLEARVESARRASEIHKKRTGKALRITEKDVMNEEMYEEEDDEIPRISYRNAMGMYPTMPAEARLHGFLSYQMMVQQAMGQYDNKGFQNYHFTNPELYNPYSLDGTMYTPMNYTNLHPQQYASIHQPPRAPVNPQMMSRFHPYTKPGHIQKRPYTNTQSPPIETKHQASTHITYQSPHASISPAPPRPQQLSPAMSQASNKSSQHQPRTPPTLTNSSGGNTPAHSGASPLATSPAICESQSTADVYNVNPLSSTFSSDVQTFLNPSYMSNMNMIGGHSNFADLDSTKSVDTTLNEQATSGQPQFSFSDLFDESLFHPQTSLFNTKGGDLQQTTTDGCHYADMNFDANAVLGLGAIPRSQTVGAEGQPTDQLLDQSKANLVDNTDLSALWSSFDDNTWQLGAEFGALES